MNTTKCSKCGKQAPIVKRNRAVVPLGDQAKNCHYYDCACGHSSWVWVRPRPVPVFDTGAIYE